MKKNKPIALDPSDLKKRKKEAQPSFMKPMLATLTKHYFSSPEWIYEHKFDGERCLAIKKNGIVTLMSRNKNEMNASYPELVTALQSQMSDNFIIDGEIVAFGKNGISDFELLQSRINLSNPVKIQERKALIPIHYYIFDLLYVDGYTICDLPLLTRKALLERLLSYNDILLYTKHRSPDGVRYFEEACKLNWEGIIAKKADSRYVHMRSRNWLKFKCAAGQELVIGGYTAPGESRTDFGALLVGYFDGKELKYAGKVGTGFTQETLTMLGKKMNKLTRKTCPFSDYDGPQSNVFWIKPELVAEFKFANWTKAGRLRVPRYQGLRNDKNAKDVVRETASDK